MLVEELLDLCRMQLNAFMNERETEDHIRILFSHYFNYTRSEIILNAKKVVEEGKEQLLVSAIKQLKSHKPIDYIINESEFLGYPLYIDNRALIPRSETEELVMLILEQEQEKSISILDIGTGSGCIPIGLAMERDFHSIEACEVSLDALEIAKKNNSKYNLNIDFYQLDILQQLPNKQFDVVVSNPPYVKEEELNHLDKNVVEHEPLIALSPFDDPLLFYKRMISIADKILKVGGRFYWEIHEDLGNETLNLFDEQPFQDCKIHQDMYGRDRFITARYTP